MVEGLSELIDAKKNQGQGEEKQGQGEEKEDQAKKKQGLRDWMSKIWNQLSIIVYLFAIAFIGTLLWAFIAA